MLDVMGSLPTVGNVVRRIESASTDNEQFYSTDVLAKAISLTFVKIPEFIHRLYVSSDLVDEKLDGKKINVKKY
ncbi:hypothetical protein KIN20_023231 [Parelaphostrongylus tenuis]|uniref:Uncharacterized protein n=1 Tax=Parelaphostrongylus tenuis TaxID=148309 RepID=A0AAD5N6C6_PARTN|nr:hypothetical protein KIN20_023231 [Parelaphostrongylus tenuis]